MQLITEQFMQYLAALDWGYIFTFICLAYAFNHWQITQILADHGLKIPVRYRTLLVGIVYGTLIFFLRGYGAGQLESLVSSLVFSMLFHKLILDHLLQRILPERIARHLRKKKPQSPNDNGYHP